MAQRRKTLKDVAEACGVHVSTVSRALNEFQRRGLIAMDGKTILLKPGFEGADLTA